MRLDRVVELLCASRRRRLARRRRPRPRLRHARAARAGRCSSASPASAPTGTTAPGSGGAGRGRARRRASARRRRAAGRRAAVRAAMARGRRRVLRPTVARARRGRHDRDERQDDDGVPAPLRSSRRPAGAPGCSGTSSAGWAGAPARRRSTTPEAIDLQRVVPRDARRRRPVVRARGVLHASAKRRLDGVRFAVARLHEPERDHLDFHGTMERYFAAKRRLFVGEHRPAGGGQRRRRLRAALADELRAEAVAGADVRARGRRGRCGRARRDAPRRHARFRPAASTLRTRSARPLQRRERPRRGRAARLLEVPDDAIVPGVAALAGRPGPLRARRGRAAVHRPRRLRAHSGLARAALEAARELTRRARAVRLRRGRRPRRDQAAGDGRGRGRARRRWRSSRPTTRVARTRRRSSRPSSAALRRLEVGARPARGDRARRRGGAAPATSS